MQNTKNEEGLNPSMQERWADGWQEHDEIYGPHKVDDPFTKKELDNVTPIL